MNLISYDDFDKVDMRVGEIVEVRDFPRAHNPSYKIRVFFGDEIGEKWSSAQLTNYPKEDLIGRQVIAVVNFAPKNIAGFLSECLILGVPCLKESDGKVSALMPSRTGVVSGRVF